MLSDQASRVFSAAACILVVLASPAVLADSGGELGARQRALNDRAVDAMIEEEYDKAIELLHESLDIGELNITWLNLGRAYAKAGRCEDALAAYDRMAVAPRVDEPPPEALYEILTGYRRELLETCPGRVIVRCAPSDLQVKIDDGETRACPNGELKLDAGTHTIVAIAPETGNTAQKQVVEVEGMSVSYVDLTATAPAEVYERDEGGIGILGATGIGTFGLGLGVLVTAGIYDLAVIVPNLDRFESESRQGRETPALRETIQLEQDVNQAMLITGGVLSAAGIGLFVLDLVLEDSDDDADSSASLDISSTVTVAPDGTPGLQIRGRF